MNINIDSARDTLCKNILIYGYCKYENKGCVFNHNKAPKQDAALLQQQQPQPPQPQPQQQIQQQSQQHQHQQQHQQQLQQQLLLNPPAAALPSSQTAPGVLPTALAANPSLVPAAATPNGDSRKRFNLNTPSFQPSSVSASSTPTTSKFAAASPKLKDVPVFVPEGLNDYNASPSALSASKKFNLSSASFTPSFVPIADSPAPPSIQLLLQPQSFQSIQHPQDHIQSELLHVIQQPSLQALQKQQQQQPQQPQQQQQQLQPPPLVTQQHIQHLPPPGSPFGMGPQASAGMHHPHPHGLSHQLHPSMQGPQTPGTGPGPQLGPPSSGYSGPPSSSADMYYQQAAATTSMTFPLQYHLYAPAPPPRLTIPLAPHETSSQDLFIPSDLRETLTKKNEATLQTFPRSNLPDHINMYHSLFALDMNNSGKSKVFGVPITPFKVFSNHDGNAYVLTKVDNESAIRIKNQLPLATMKQWISIKSANIVKVNESFTTMAFNSIQSSLVLIYDYYPDSNTLQEQHIIRKLGGKLEPLNEDTLVSYVIQITNGLLAIHEKGLAARQSIDITKILVTNKNRVKIGWVGLLDILSHDSDEIEINEKYGGVRSEFVKSLQLGDLKRFYKIIVDLSLLCLPLHMREGGVKNFALVFSQDYINILSGLQQSTSIAEFSQKHLSHKLMNFISSLQDGQDYMELQLTSELENARLFRLLTKINFLVEKNLGSSGKSNNTNSNNQSLNNDWKENGPNYVIKLFKDFIFNEVNEFGKPTLNLSRVLTCLNKLDAGIEETILLVSEDEKSCIIVSYKEVKELIGSAFRSLMRE